MIGQKRLKDNLLQLKINGFPRFIIITGQNGQGKKTLANEIKNMLGFHLTKVGIRIDDLRYMIEVAYKQTSPIIYLIADADDMSLGAKNSLLKIIEEPPQNAYFIMTLTQIENTLPTIASRCCQLNMDYYTLEEKTEMINDICPNASKEEIDILTQLDNYEQIQKILSYGINNLYDYVNTVYNNIYKVQSANSFKLAEKLDLKDTGKGYDLDLFLSLYSKLCLYNMFYGNNTNKEVLDKCIAITQHYRNELSKSGVNKHLAFDMWILDIRKEWLTLLDSK